MDNRQFPTSHCQQAQCAAIGAAVLESAFRRSRHAYVACHVVLAHRTVIVAGELGFWPPLGAYEGVCGELEHLVHQVLARFAGSLDHPPKRFTVVNELRRLPAARAKALASIESGERAGQVPNASLTVGHALVSSHALPSSRVPTPIVRPAPARRCADAGVARQGAASESRVIG